jgi:tRNA (guanine37-N1)-methyltransferase
MRKKARKGLGNFLANMKKNLKFYLKGKLPEKELALVPSSFDAVGDIMIFSDFPKELIKKEKVIGSAILQNYPNIKTILKKTRKYSGKFRTAKLKNIAGEKRKETVYKENDVSIKLDVEKVYFSPRLSSERKRIANLVKPNESVLVMFSGCGVYPIVIGKNTKCSEVYGIEINPIAHKYAMENVKKNKLEKKIELFYGDVDKVMPKLSNKFDRILMPLPKGGEKFLGTALKHAKKKAAIHFYYFAHDNEFDGAEKKIKNVCKNARKKIKMMKIIKCGQYSPGFYRICIDFEVI